MIGIDSDNGSEFINNDLFEFCVQHRITFTRSRPGDKNDGAHVEPKNWSRFRELVGCQHHDTAGELELLSEIWELDRIFTNYLLPEQILIAEVRHGAEVSRTHDRAATAHGPAAADPALSGMPAKAADPSRQVHRGGARALTGPGSGACLDARLAWSIQPVRSAGRDPGCARLYALAWIAGPSSVAHCQARPSRMFRVDLPRAFRNLQPIRPGGGFMSYRLFLLSPGSGATLIRKGEEGP